VVHQFINGNAEAQGEVFSIGAGASADAPVGMVFDVVEEDGAAFKGVGHVGNFKGGVYGFANGDEIAYFGGLFEKVTKLHEYLSILVLWEFTG
jgi:hypothetical protein